MVLDGHWDYVPPGCHYNYDYQYMRFPTQNLTAHIIMVITPGQSVRAHKNVLIALPVSFRIKPVNHRARRVQWARRQRQMHFHVTIVQLANTAMMVPRANSALQANTRTRQPNHRAQNVLWDLSLSATSNHVRLAKRH